MILEVILNLIKGLIKIVFNLLPNIPNVPTEVQDTVSQYINMISSNMTFVSFFLDVNYTKTILTVLIVLIGFRESYKFIMWIYHKLPVSSQ